MDAKKMSSPIRYALLVPCYNAERYIDGFIENISALHKSFDEVIFYDDASTDDTATQIRNRGYKVIKSNKNMGPGFARNRLAEETSCEYIHFHDIDDEISTDFLVLVNEKLEANNTDVIIGFADWIDKNTRKSIILWKYDEVELEKNPLAYFISNPLGIINTVYRRATFLAVNGFNEELMCWEDADLHVRLAASNVTFQVIDKVIAWSLRHNNGISSNQEHCWKCRLCFLANYLNNYAGLLKNDVLKNELKKIQTVFINMGLYSELKRIFELDKKHNLKIRNYKVSIIYFANKILPSVWLKNILGYLIQK